MHLYGRRSVRSPAYASSVSDTQEETLKKSIEEMQAGEAFMTLLHMIGAEIIASAVREYKSNERVTKHFKNNGRKQKQSDNAGSKQ
jgi:hypothetical protein